MIELNWHISKFDPIENKESFGYVNSIITASICILIDVFVLVTENEKKGMLERMDRKQRGKMTNFFSV